MKEKIKDIRNALDNGCFLSALALALTLPDICGRVKFRGEKGKKVYIYWFDEFVSPYYQSDDKYADVYKGTEFNGTVCYSLRCAYLHSGNADLKEQDPYIEINQFDLCLSNNKNSGVYVDMHEVITPDCSDEKMYRVRLDVRKLCKILCDAAEKYYIDHEDKEMFKEHAIRIISMEEEMCRINSNYKPITAGELQK